MCVCVCVQHMCAHVCAWVLSRGATRKKDKVQWSEERRRSLCISNGEIKIFIVVPVKGQMNSLTQNQNEFLDFPCGILKVLRSFIPCYLCLRNNSLARKHWVVEGQSQKNILKVDPIQSSLPLPCPIFNTDEGTGLPTGNGRARSLMVLPCSLPGIRGLCMLQEPPGKWSGGEGMDLPVLFLVHSSWQIYPTVGHRPQGLPIRWC